MDKLKTGRVIKEKRIARGMTQSQLADVLGVSNKAVSRWETGNSFPDITLLDKLSEVLAVNVEELIAGGGINKPNLSRKSVVHIEPDFGRFDTEDVAQKEQEYRKFLGHKYVKDEVSKLKKFFLVLVAIIILLLINSVFVKKDLIRLAVKMHMQAETHMNLDYDNIIISEYLDGFDGYKVSVMDKDEEVLSVFVSAGSFSFVGRFLPGNIRCVICGLPG